MNLNILKKFPTIKENDRNLLILDKKYENISNFEKNIRIKIKRWMPTFLPIYVIYYGKAYNPPFFNNIIALRKLSIEDIQEIWNMTVFGGFICIPNFYKNKFENLVYYEDLKNGYVIIQKKILKTFYFKEYRIIDFIIAGYNERWNYSRNNQFIKTS